MILYKFTSSARTINILQSGKIRFAQLSSLNDPFESLLPIDGYITKDLFLQFYETIMSDETLLNKVIDEAINSTYDKLNPIQKMMFNKNTLIPSMRKYIKDELENRGTNLKDFILAKYKTDFDSVISNMRKNVISYMADVVCVLSLSLAKTNLLMWSHYSDSHRGIAIGFDSNDPFFYNIMAIRYQSEKPVIDFSVIPSTEKEKEYFAQKLLAVKNIAWHHEEEYRLIRPSTAMDLLNHRDSKGFPVYVSPFPKKSVVELIFGNKCSEEDQAKVQSIISSEYSNVKLYKSILDSNGYQLSFALI
jgi:Protein of unknown function (DUF2971).